MNKINSIEHLDALGAKICELCRDQNLKDGYPQNFLHRD